MSKVGGEAFPVSVLPHVDNLRPATCRANCCPDTEAELIAFFASDWAPISCHVVHVFGAVMARDLYELMDIYLVITE
ncbi:unannotated protein [freshwater metagenome]|uniref:Unannotated protein n=1 Tax=freshwater metagenome TaxID=449393 RepID=A0A6J7JEI4_9ZZZZ